MGYGYILEENLDAVLQQHKADDVTELVLMWHIANKLMSSSERFVRSITVNYSTTLVSNGRFIGWYEYKGNYIKITRRSRYDVLSGFGTGTDVCLRVVGLSEGICCRLRP